MPDVSVAELLPRKLCNSFAAITNEVANLQSKGSRFTTPSKTDVIAWWESGMPRNLVPVVTEKNDEFTDYYCLNLEDGSPVVVFCDHAIVNCWDTVELFLRWLSDQM